MIPNSYIVANNNRNARAKKEQDINRSNSGGHSANGAYRTLHGTVYVAPRKSKRGGITFASGSTPSTTMTEFQISSVLGDHLIGRIVTRNAQGSASVAGSNYTIAKPYDLRWSTWSGSTGDTTYPGEIKSYKSGSTVTYTEVLKPSYTNATIMAVSNNSLYMGTGSYSSASLNGTASGYTDINIDARKYMPVIQSMYICITANGVSTTKQFKYFGGEPYV